MPAFIGIIASIDMLRDRLNRFFDTARSSGIRMASYYSAKIIAYMLIEFTILLIAEFLNISVYCLRTDGLASYTAYTIPESFGLAFLRVFVFSLNALPIYTALAVSFALISKSPIVGITANIAVSMSKYIILYPMTFFSDYIFPVPYNIVTFFGYYKAHAPEYMVVHIPVTDVVISYAYGFAISAVLFTIGYLWLKKLQDK